MVEFADMTALVAVVETASFTDAARRLGTTKSVVSRRIAELEKELGAPLLDRSSRSVRATEIGAVYYAKCVRILESVGAANDFVAGHNQLVQGRLRIAVAGDAGACLLLPLLDGFAAKFPDVLLEVEADERDANLSESHFDIALRIGRLGDSALVARPLTAFRRWLCAAPAYLRANGAPQSLSDLAGHHGLLDARADGNGFWQLLDGDETQAVRVRERLRSNSAMHLRDAAVAGLGIALLPAPIAAPAVADGRLALVLPQHAPPPEPVSLVYPKSRRNSPKVQSLLGYLAESIGEPPPWEPGMGNRE